jgi:DNA polymerase-1
MMDRRDLGNQVLLAVDGSNVLYQASHSAAAREDGARSGEAIAGEFLRVVFLAEELVRPALIVVTWDSGRSLRRVALFPEYKAARRARWATETEEEALLREARDGASRYLRRGALQGLGIEQHRGPGECPTEGDDLLARAVTGARGRGFTGVVLLSTDGDLDQLVTPSAPGVVGELPVVRMSPRKLFPEEIKGGEGALSPWEQVVDGGSVYERHGWVPADHVLAKAILGDTSDSISGVPGVGPVTVRNLVEAFGSLPEAFERVNEIPSKVKRARALATPEALAVVARNVGMIELDPEVLLCVEAAEAYPGAYGDVHRRGVFRVLVESGVLPDLGDADGGWSGAGLAMVTALTEYGRRAAAFLRGKGGTS